MRETAAQDVLLRRIGAAIRRHRKSCGWTQERLAESACLSPYFIGSVERGQAALSMRSLAQIADVLAVPMAALFAWDGEPDREALTKEMRHLVAAATVDELRAMVEVGRAMTRSRR